MKEASTIGLLLSAGVVISGLYFMAMADNETTDAAESIKMKKGLKLLGAGAGLAIISGIAFHKST